jgi:hypothetical protein
MTTVRRKLFLASALLLLVALSLTPSGLRAENNLTISGKISSINGEPVAGAEVYLYSSGNTRKPADFISPRTTVTGHYRMTVPKAAYRAVARLKKGERYGPLMPGDRHSGEPVRIVPDEEQELTLDFTIADMQEMAQRREKDRELLAEISGTVTTDGKSIASVYVYARTKRTASTLPEYFSGWTAADGRYSLKLPQGQYFLGLATEFPPSETAAILKEVLISADKLPVAIDLQLPLQ